MKDNSIDRRIKPELDKAVVFYEMGFSIRDCAKYFGISRQSMHQNLKRRGVVFRSNRISGVNNPLWCGGEQIGRDKGRWARYLVEQGIKKGIIIPSPCSVCGDNKSQAHHGNYGEPLDVIWLCRKHHLEWHKNNAPKAPEQIVKDTLGRGKSFWGKLTDEQRTTHSLKMNAARWNKYYASH